MQNMQMLETFLFWEALKNIIKLGEQEINRLEMQRQEAKLLASVNREGSPLSSGSVRTGYGVEALKVGSFSVDSPAQEKGPESNHEIPYHFTAAASWSQALAWIRLLAKVHRGELEP